MEGSEHEAEKIERLRRAMYSRALSEKLRDKPRRDFETDEAPVREDFFRQEAGAPKTIVAPRAIGFARKALWTTLAVSVVFFVAALCFFGYYFLFGPGSGDATSGNISITVGGPPQIEGGAPTEFQISVGNRNRVPLELTDLVITFPDGTRSPVDFSTPLLTLRQPLGTIESGGIRQGTVSAVLSGSAGEPIDIKIELEYHLSGSSAVFVARTNYHATFSSSPLSVAVSGNTETISGQPVQLVATISSNTNAPIHDVLLNAQYPFGFKFSSASPAPTKDKAVWELGDLSPGQQKVVTIQGSLAGAQGDQRIFHFTAGTRADTASSTISTQLSSSAFTVAISQPFLGLTSFVNGASSTVVLSPGDNVTVSIGWRNNLDTQITNAAIVARLTGFQIDGTTVKSPSGFFRSSDGTVLWDKSTDPSLATLAPGARGVASFSFQIPTSDALKNVSNPYLTISVNAAGNRVAESGVPESLQAATRQKIVVASDLQLSAQGLYYSNPFGSSGPVPPKAGVETTYAVLFTLGNTTNKITNASVTAQFPPYVRWVGIYSPNTEKVSFDHAQGTVTWELGDVDPGIGLNGVAPRQMAIAVGFMPSTSQIGQQPALLRNITLTGIDASTGSTITRTTKTDVTTNLLQVAKTSESLVEGTDVGFTAASATVVK